MNFAVILFGLILSMGVVSSIPLTYADSTISSSKSNPDSAFTAATFTDKYKDVKLTGKRVPIVISVSGESDSSDPSKRAKEIRYLQSYVLKFLSFSNAVNVISNQQKNEITANIDIAWIPILEKRSDVISVTVFPDSPRNVSLKAQLSQNPGMTGDIFWLIMHNDEGTLVTTSDSGVIVIRFDFIDHDKCYDTPDTFCLKATLTDTKNSYFTESGDEATIIVEYPDQLTFSILSGELVTNTFDLDIQKIKFLDKKLE